MRMSSLLECSSAPVEEVAGMLGLLMLSTFERRFLASAAPPQMVKAMRKVKEFILISAASYWGMIEY